MFSDASVPFYPCKELTSVRQQLLLESAASSSDDGAVEVPSVQAGRTGSSHAGGDVDSRPALERRKSPKPRARRSRTRSGTRSKPHAQAAGDMRSSTKRSRRGRGMWDVGPESMSMVAPAAQPHAVPACQGQQSHAPAGARSRANEVWVGNLAIGKVTAGDLRDAFRRLFHGLPEYLAKYPAELEPVTDVFFPQVGLVGSFAFVRFLDTVLANTAILLSGLDLCGRAVTVGHCRARVGQERGDTRHLDVTPLREAGLIPFLPDSFETRLGELYFGNLNVGAVDEAVITELVTPVCTLLPEYDPRLGLPVQKVYMGPCGTYCFVRFQNAHMASRVLPVFDGTNLLGRALKVRRPSRQEAHFDKPKGDERLQETRPEAARTEFKLL